MDKISSGRCGILSLERAVSMRTDESLSMTGVHSGFQAFVKQVAPHAIFTRCIFQRYALGLKTLRLISSMYSLRLINLLIISKAMPQVPELSNCCLKMLEQDLLYYYSTQRFVGYHGRKSHTA